VREIEILRQKMPPQRMKPAEFAEISAFGQSQVRSGPSSIRPRESASLIAQKSPGTLHWPAKCLLKVILPKAMRVKRGYWRFYSRNYTLGELEVTYE